MNEELLTDIKPVIKQKTRIEYIEESIEEIFQIANKNTTDIASIILRYEEFTDRSLVLLKKILDDIREMKTQIVVKPETKERKEQTDNAYL